MKLSGVGEASIIGLFQHAFAAEDAGLRMGIGDDAAVLANGGPERFRLVTADLLIEDIHFERRTITPFQLGFKSVAVNVSDLRAMGGVSRFLLYSLALPGDLDFQEIEQFADGIRAATSRFGGVVIGGDTCRSAAGIVISVTAIGETARPVYRSGARVGDGIYVSGTLGDASLGLELLRRLGSRIDPEHLPREGLASRLGLMCREEDLLHAIYCHLMPEPVMTDMPPEVSAMIDVSDGLVLDLSRLCDASGVGVCLEASRIPIAEGTRRISALLGLDPLELALQGGEDYQLLFTAPDGLTLAGATRIGKIVQEGREILKADGQPLAWPTRGGYDHFEPIIPA